MSQIEAYHVKVSRDIVLVMSNPDMGEYTAIAIGFPLRTATAYSKADAFFTLIEQFFSRSLPISTPEDSYNNEVTEEVQK